ncbi:MAG TPA: F0F1 ATP synthase subunit A [Thermoanaerobaculia bacterium]|jgi:F-type H+-transporting ATPase subunit a|nr:F0F1 ATP synthase subunit A [Thermoanaerobaculia bacterium]
MEHESSILYAPVNALWHAVQHRYAWDIPDHVVMALLVLAISAVVFPLMARRISRENPSHFQQMLEVVVSGLKDLLRDIIGHDGDRHLYIIGSFAAFIFISNIFSLFFFLQPPTTNPNTTFGLAICAFLYYNWQGIKTQGIVHYLKHFMGPVLFLAPLMIPIEIIGHLARILSLGMRLFGNIFGEHAVTGVFMAMLPFVLPWPMMGLGIFGAFLQTFVFIMLTMVYIAGATVVEEH